MCKFGFPDDCFLTSFTSGVIVPFNKITDISAMINISHDACDRSNLCSSSQSTRA